VLVKVENSFREIQVQIIFICRKIDKTIESLVFIGSPPLLHPPNKNLIFRLVFALNCTLKVQSWASKSSCSKKDLIYFSSSSVAFQQEKKQ